jgi:hypothetical protein
VKGRRKAGESHLKATWLSVVTLLKDMAIPQFKGVLILFRTIGWVFQDGPIALSNALKWSEVLFFEDRIARRRGRACIKKYL